MLKVALKRNSIRKVGAHMFNIINFKNSLVKIANNVINNKLMIKTEKQTNICVILPFLSAMGYDIDDPSEVKREFCCKSENRTGRVDFAVFRDNKIYMLIEVKSLAHKLCNKDINQLSSYFVSNSSEIGLLTNGLDFYFYKASGKNQKMSCFPYIYFNIIELVNNDYVINQLSQLAGRFSRVTKQVSVIKEKITEEKVQPEQTDQFDAEKETKSPANGVSTEALPVKKRGTVKSSEEQYIVVKSTDNPLPGLSASSREVNVKAINFIAYVRDHDNVIADDKLKMRFTYPVVGNAMLTHAVVRCANGTKIRLGFESNIQEFYDYYTKKDTNYGFSYWE
jgi:hypothetical protein